MIHKLMITVLFSCCMQPVVCQVKKATPGAAVKRPTAAFPDVKDDPNPVKYIQLKKDTPVYTPTNFYIQKVVVSTNSDDSIGFVIQPKSGKQQRVAFKNGTPGAVEEYFNFKIVKDTTLYPIVFTLTNISLSEEKDKDYRNGLFKYAYSFDYWYKDKALKIGSADGRLTYKTHITQNKQLDSNIARSLVFELSEVENNFREMTESHPAFCKGVNIYVSYSSHNSFTADTLFYDGQQELMWDDFAADPNDGDEFFYPNFGLVFTPEMKYEKGKYEVQINTGPYLLKSASWVGKKAKSTQLLTHLQYRFKMAGIESLMLKKKLETTSFSCDNYESELRNLIVNANKHLQQTGDEYNRQTRTGTDKKEQKRWQEQIEEQLMALKK